MYTRLDDFLSDAMEDSLEGQKLYDALTDASLTQAVADGHRTLGQIAWHSVQSVTEMLNRTGLGLDASHESEPVPLLAGEIADAHRQVWADAINMIREEWTDETLEMIDDMWGMQWTRGRTLMTLLIHEAHHRGQMTVLMRQAGLTVHGVYGPAKEEWAQMGMEPPAV